ncbi:MAG: hypothetical protein PVI90_10625 [Desulfobacteraceae bacterium]|jgi:hypothetical protein
MDKSLKDELVKMAEADQHVLQELAERGELGTTEYHPKIKEVHMKNTARMKEIIEKYGWPGNDLVGQDGTEAAWMIVQHAVLDIDFMKSCVPLLENAVKRQQAEGWQLAFLQDRLLTIAGQPQIYGTQFDHDVDGWPVPYPIADEVNVNQRRAELGLNSLEERIAEMRKLEKWVRDQRDKNSS